MTVGCSCGSGGTPSTGHKTTSTSMASESVSAATITSGSESDSMEESSSTDVTTAGGFSCEKCEKCEAGRCVTQCTNWDFGELADCETKCLPPTGECKEKVDVCSCEIDICGSDLELWSLDNGYGQCGDYICGPQLCSICSECHYLECEPTNPVCPDDEKCIPVDIYGDEAPDWTHCVPSEGTTPSGSPCTPHTDTDECEDGAVCVFEVCRPFCFGDSFDCPEGLTCSVIDGWLPLCVPEP